MDFRLFVILLDQKCPVILFYIIDVTRIIYGRGPAVLVCSTLYNIFSSLCWNKSSPAVVNSILSTFTHSSSHSWCIEVVNNTIIEINVSREQNKQRLSVVKAGPLITLLSVFLRKTVTDLKKENKVGKAWQYLILLKCFFLNLNWAALWGRGSKRTWNIRRCQ